MSAECRSPGLADLHFHLLPGLDDGPACMEESVALARAAAEEGTTTIVATPHVRGDFVTDIDAVVHGTRELEVTLRALGLDIAVLRGAELGHDMVGCLGQHELDLIAQGPPEARWLLVETPFEGIHEAFHAATAELRERGFGVVVAHPERSADAESGSEGLRRELARGAAAQVNAMSLAGGHGPEACAAGLALVREGLVEIVGSDAHGPTRPPALRRAFTCMLGGGVPVSVARDLVNGAPRRLLTRGVPQPQAGTALAKEADPHLMLVA